MYDFFSIYFSCFFHLSFLYCYTFHLQAYFKLRSSTIQFITSFFFSSSIPAMDNLEKLFSNKSFSYCLGTHQRIPDFATLQCFIFWWPGSSTAATTNNYSPTQPETAAQKPSLGLILDPRLPPWPSSLLGPMATP